MIFNKKLLPACLLSAALAGAITSCQKKFDPTTYQPERPIGGYSSSKEIAPSDLVGYWAFDGSLIDSVTKTSGTAAGTTFAKGIKGQALQGTATSYALFNPGAALQNLQSFTISFWMYAPKNNSAVGVFSLTNTKDFWGSLDIYFDNGGNQDTAVFKVHINNDNVNWKGQFTDTRLPGAFNKWVHIAITYDAGNSKFNIYENGTAVGVNSAGNSPNTVGPALHGDAPSTNVPYGPIKFVNATGMAFGAFQFQTNPSLTTSASAQSWASDYAGLLDEFRIYDKALSDADVHALYKLESLGR